MSSRDRISSKAASVPSVMMITDLLHIIFSFIIYIRLFLNICFPYWLSTCFVVEDEPELCMLLLPFPRGWKDKHSHWTWLIYFRCYVFVCVQWEKTSCTCVHVHGDRRTALGTFLSCLFIFSEHGTYQFSFNCWPVSSSSVCLSSAQMTGVYHPVQLFKWVLRF